jgi:uncharacterized protein YggE
MTAIKAALLASALLLGAVANAKADDSHYIVVSGEGSVMVKPDSAELNAGVSARGPTTRAALDASSEVMGKLMEAAKAAGLEDSDIRTTQVGINPVYDRPRQGAEPKITAYESVNRVSLRIRKLDDLPTILDGVVAAGVTNVDGLRFVIADPQAATDEARRKAVADAKHKAEIMAEAAGAWIGPVDWIEERDGRVARPMPMPMSVEALQKSVPVAPGEQEIRIAVTVRYGLQM